MELWNYAMQLYTPLVTRVLDYGNPLRNSAHLTTAYLNGKDVNCTLILHPVLIITMDWSHQKFQNRV
ncbi:hypothetical protein CHUAL_007278 [Chamberlinius hualienensis]